VFSFQKWHWTKQFEKLFGLPFWLSQFPDWSGTVHNEQRNKSPVGWRISWKTKLYATRPFCPMQLWQMFFCLNEITNGIAHPPKKKAKVTMEYKCRTRVMMKKCTNVQVNLGLKAVQSCRMSYRKQLTTELSAKE
jgi:hypothetical protein